MHRRSSALPAFAAFQQALGCVQISRWLPFGLILFLFICLIVSRVDADARPFIVGVSLPLSGAFAEYGEAVRNGITLAHEDDPELFKRINFIYEDNSYDPKKTVISAQKMADYDRVDVLFIWGNEPGLAVAPVAERRQLPAIVVAQYPGVSVGRRFVIRFLNSGEQYSQTLLDYFRTKGITKISVIKSELSFFNMLLEGLQRLAVAEQVEVVETLLPADMDFRSSILKIKRHPHQILGVYVSPTQAREFFRQAAQLNFKPSVFGATTFESKAALSDVLEHMEGAVFTHNAVTERFEQRYVARYATDVQLAYAANAYDFAMLTGRRLSRIFSPTTPAQIIDAYCQPGQHEGAAGPYHFADSVEQGGRFEFDIVVKRISQGKFREIYRRGFGLQSG